MGLFGDDDNGNSDQAARANRLTEEQINSNKAELEQKRQAMVQTRIDIVRSQGAEKWNQ